MARALPPLLLLSLVVALSTQGCSCSDNGPSRGDAGGDDDGGGGDNGVNDGSVDTGPRDMNLPDVPPFVPPDVHVIITTDNAYGYGTGSALVDYFEGIEDGGNDIFLCSAACDDETPCSVGSCDTFGTCNEDRRGPETYVVPGNLAPQEGYLYVIGWSDESVTQGLIGQFSASDGSSPAVYTGSPDWQVCATGMDLDPFMDMEPSVELINSQIVNCNMGAAGTTFSDGWIGDDLENNPSGAMELTVLSDVSMEPPQFANLCQADNNSDPGRTGDSLDAEARWMWFDENNADATSAFQSNGSPRGDFLIFRLPIESVIIFE